MFDNNANGAEKKKLNIWSWFFRGGLIGLSVALVIYGFMFIQVTPPEWLLSRVWPSCYMMLVDAPGIMGLVILLLSFASNFLLYGIPCMLVAIAINFARSRSAN